MIIKKHVSIIIGFLFFSSLLLACGGSVDLSDSVSENERSQSAGLYGTVTDNAGAAIESATVILIPADDINTARLDIADFSPDATDDEPLEDLVNDTTKSYQTTTTDVNGDYSFASVTEDSYFIYVKPADTDTSHLPGGSLCRISRQLTNTGLNFDIEISTNPSAAATYVGSSTCLTCHSDKTTIYKTGHFNSLHVPASDSDMQDVSAFDDFNDALDKFNGTTTVYFYDYDSTRGFDKYKTAETSSGTVSFRIRLLKTGDTYQMEFTNVKNASDPNNGIVYDVDLAYGGAVYKQRYLTRLAVSHAVLPLQYQQEGSESNSPRTRKVWRDYHGSYWYNETTQLFTTPANSKSFDNNCAGCHFTGYSLGGDSTNGYAATAVSDTDGTYDFDADGDLDEINTGCEVCHGPGSEHVASGGATVALGLLTPERESIVCGQCHSRPKGALGTDVPDNADGDMMRPGNSRSYFLENHTNGTQYDTSSSDLYTDVDQSSKSHHQQYTDFIRSSLYKNNEQLVTCSNCHNMHGTDNFRSLTATTSDDALCTDCHPDKTTVTEHTEDKLGTSTDMGAVCIDCHMNKIAKTGAGRQGNGSYWENDVTSHLFSVARKTTSIVAGQTVSDSLMSIPYTNSCTSACHDSDLSDD
ncbi:MAG: hypothetical protein A3G32_01200 [Deltaproteobacteria bacterium RIFCSPLOWO2_12_FULL_40_28]|nr:MAG: hypothetical protein A3C45_10085 [Deltaproteobacteria bacterium RIFCSPHIGHO2_02_FULL_40_28]OGQ19947.1 MAG: hypothetical protein A3E27_07035 [Deltaproteobacteria bacterium RIFCSPHIGHO2_12_FULL_40_32]OGQ39706.1 MAG: hypothetical protein A3I69_06465 [Deltaproteobacteria bacterium RIFCSPLOWO2_02_FULL_40_36]OGQ52961.1 MAG: hypothetical protein A3G32_01200 [Deltaproteobacteria bacterium RIFCSPLOWO2_12_FULL_40_28]